MTGTLVLIPLKSDALASCFISRVALEVDFGHRLARNCHNRSIGIVHVERQPVKFGRRGTYAPSTGSLMQVIFTYCPSLSYSTHRRSTA